MTKKDKCITIFEEKIHSLVFPLDIKIEEIFGQYPTNYDYKVFDYVRGNALYQFMRHYCINRPKTFHLDPTKTSEKSRLDTYIKEGGSEFFKNFRYDKKLEV